MNAHPHNDSTNNDSQDYDLSFLTGHQVSGVSFSLNSITIVSFGPEYHALLHPNDVVTIIIESDFDFNDKRNCRGDLVSLLDQTYGKCTIDQDFNLVIQLVSGKKLIVTRSNYPYESYSIDYEKDPKRHILV